MYYSQILDKARIENVCAKCETRFPTWSVYHSHAVGGGCVKKIKPINTSGRSKAQIVIDWELKHKGAII